MGSGPALKQSFIGDLLYYLFLLDKIKFQRFFQIKIRLVILATTKLVRPAIPVSPLILDTRYPVNKKELWGDWNFRVM